MMWAQAHAITRAETTTDETRAIAREIERLSEKLGRSLRQRREK